MKSLRIVSILSFIGLCFLGETSALVRPEASVGVVNLRYYKVYCSNFDDYEQLKMIFGPSAYVPLLPNVEIDGDSIVITTRHHFFECAKFTQNAYKFVPADKYLSKYTVTSFNPTPGADHEVSSKMDPLTGLAVHRHKIKKFLSDRQMEMFKRHENLYEVHLQVKLWGGNFLEFAYNATVDLVYSDEFSKYNTSVKFHN